MAIALAVIATLAAIALLARPRDRGGGYGEYFSRLNAALKEAGVGRPRLVVDLDRLDANLDALRERGPSGSRCRVVFKSLPSPELARHVADRMGTRKYMAVHEPFIAPLLETVEPGSDILVGKTLPSLALAEFYAALPASLRSRAQGEVTWLVDARALLAEYRGFAERERLTLRACVELDVGLERGGVSDPGELDGLLSDFEAAPGALRFGGFLGYDGHVAHAPPLRGTARATALAEFERCMARYRRLADFARERHPGLFAAETVANAGGSATYALYAGVDSVTDASLGGGVMGARSYPRLFLEGVEPAEFIAAPVIKDLPGDRVPFIGRLSRLIELWDPNARRTLVIYGGGWAAEVVAPPGVKPQALTNDPPNQNLVPNESSMSASRGTPIRVGDYVFYQPEQSDAMFQFEDLLLVRGGRVVGTWKTVGRGY